MQDKIIPIEIADNDKIKIGFLDVSDYSLSELINLKKELSGSIVNSVCAIDAIIKQNIGTYYDENLIKSVKRAKKKTKCPINKNKIYIDKKYR